MGAVSNLFNARNKANTAEGGNRAGSAAPGQSQFQATATPLTQSQYQDLIAQQTAAAGNTQAADATGQSQTELSKTLLEQAQGRGAVQDLTQAQLTAASGAAQQQAAGLAASQKGMNPALMARSILQNNAQMQQQAANQSAQNKAGLTMQSQGAAGAALGQQRGQDIQQQQTNIGALGTAGNLQNAQNALNVQQNLGIQGINAGTAQSNAAQQTQAALGNSGVNAGIAGQNANTNANIAGGILGGIAAGGGAMMGGGGKYDGGVIEPYAPGFADGGFAMPTMGSQFQSAAPSQFQYAPPASSGYAMPEMGAQFNQPAAAPNLGAPGAPASSNVPGAMGAFGSSMGQAQLGSTLQGVDTGIPDYTNKGKGITGWIPEKIEGAKKAATMAMMAYDGGRMPMIHGGHVPGQPKVRGNNPINDTVPAVLSPGEIVIPNSITQSPHDAPQKAAAFVAEQLRKTQASSPKKMNQGGKVSANDEGTRIDAFLMAIKKQPESDEDGPKSGFAAVLHAHNKLEKKMAAIEKLMKKQKAS